MAGGSRASQQKAFGVNRVCRNTPGVYVPRLALAQKNPERSQQPPPPPPPPPPPTHPKSEAGQGSTSPTHQSLSDEEGGREGDTERRARSSQNYRVRSGPRGRARRTRKKFPPTVFSHFIKSHDFTCDYSVGNWRGSLFPCSGAASCWVVN